MQSAQYFQESELQSWLLDRLCPFWASEIVDPAGGYFEGLDTAGAAIRGGTRSILTQARLTYVFSHACCLRPTLQFRHAAEHGFHFLRRAFEMAGADGGWPRTIDVDGTPVDATRDAYDQSFVILALAWHYQALANPEALHLADLACRFIQTRLADREHGGVFEEYPLNGGRQKLPRRQNPHMHLLEAMLAMFQATRSPCWLDRARELVALFERHFFEPNRGSLIEYFDAAWSPAGGLREPGHHFEWVWLLHSYFDMSQDVRAVDYANRLFEFGSKFGLDPDGGLAGMVFDGVDSDGCLIADSKLLWPQTEYVKACLALAQRRGDARMAASAYAHIAALRRHFFKADGASWHNQLSRSGEPLQSATPARVLYHVFAALAEALRCEPAASALMEGARYGV